MGNIWTDASAPYVLVAAMGAMGWVVNTSLDDLKLANIIEYEISNVTENKKHFVVVDVFNRSLTKDLSSGQFTFRCSGKTTADCFSNTETGTPIIFSPLSGVSNSSPISPMGSIYAAKARLAPQSAARYKVGVNSTADEIVLLYEPDIEAKNEGLIFRKGSSWEGWLIAHYLGVLIQTFFVLAGLFGIWLLINLILLLRQLYKKPETVSTSEKPETYKIILEYREAQNG